MAPELATSWQLKMETKFLGLSIGHNQLLGLGWVYVCFGLRFSFGLVLLFWAGLLATLVVIRLQFCLLPELRMNKQLT